MQNYSRDELLQAFNKVCNKDNWKLPIDAMIERSEEEIIREAVIYFTGCEPSFQHVPGSGKSRVTAVGYYNAVGA